VVVTLNVHIVFKSSTLQLGCLLKQCLLFLYLRQHEIPFIRFILILTFRVDYCG
jgi:hypothetical protein